MINKLTYDQIADCWDLIKEGIEETVPYPIAGRHRYRESNILTSLLSGGMECWMSYERDEENETILLYSISLLTIYTDECTGNRALNLFAHLVYRDIPPDMWQEFFESVKKYAKSQKCHSVVSTTDRPEIVQLANELGIDTSFTLLYLPLEEE